MLNEFAEYQLYYNEKHSIDRIILSEKSDRVKGLKRAFVIVARGIIFHTIYPDGLPDTMSDNEIKTIKNELKDWEETCLKPYVKKTAKNIGKSAAKMLEAVSISDLKESDDIGANMITYDRIIAKAINDGPLKERFLLASAVDHITNDFMGIRVFKTGKASDIEVLKQNGEKQRYCLLKLLSAYLINRLPGNEWSLITNSDIEVWGNKKIGRFNPNYYKYCWESGKNRKPLFEKKSKDNFSKYRFDSEWMDKCGWKLVEANELEEILTNAPDTVYFGDDGLRLLLRPIPEMDIME